jgi:hypothetical protein
MTAKNLASRICVGIIRAESFPIGMAPRLRGERHVALSKHHRCHAMLKVESAVWLV